MTEEIVYDGTMARRWLAAELQNLREESGLSAAQAAAELGVSAASLYRIERNTKVVTIPEARELCRIYGRPDLAETFADLAKASKVPPWYRLYGDVVPADFGIFMSLEQAAVSFRQYHVQLIPGSLQTEAYASVIIGGEEGKSEEERTRRMQIRLQRQALLSREGVARWHFILDAEILYRPIGGPTVMKDQLARLLEISELPDVTLSIVPRNTGMYAGVITGPFVLMDFPDGPTGKPSEPPTVYVEGFAGALYTVEKDEVDQYARAFEQIRLFALGPENTRKAIMQAMEEMEMEKE